MEDSSDASSVLADVCDVKSPIEHQLSSVNDADSVSNGISPEAMHSSDSNEVAYHSPTSPAVDQDSYSAPDVDQDSCVAPDVTSEPESESRSNFQLDLASEAEGSLQPPGDSHSELNLQPSSEFEAELHSQSAMDSQLQPTSQSARDLQSQSIQDNESALQLENAESQPLNVESNGKAAGSLEGDVISEDENFKEDNDDGELEEGEHKDDEELDFEEGEQTNSPKQVKENEDGEVESEDELEEGEVKEDDEDDPSESSAAQSNANPSVCRFYHKGLCTWGSSCRFVHNDPPNVSTFQKPNNSIANRLTFPGKPNEMPIKIPPQRQQPNFLLKTPILSNPPYMPLQPPQVRMQDKSWDNRSNNNNHPQHNNNSNISNSNMGNTHGNNSTPSYKPDQYVQRMPPRMDQRMDRRDPELDFDRAAVYSSRPRYVDQSNDPPSGPSYSSGYNRSRTGTTPDSNYESEYERKRRLAFEAAPWNDTVETPPPAPQAPQRTPGFDRYGRPIVFSRDRAERNDASKETTSSRDSYRGNSRDSSRDSSSRDAYGRSSRDAPDQFRDPWRRSKSPSTKMYSGPTSYKHTKSDSGSNFSENEMDAIPDARSEAQKRRLDPTFANKHRPSSFKDPPLPTSSHGDSVNGAYESSSSRPMGSLDSRKGYYNSNVSCKRQPESPPLHPQSSSAYPRSGSPVYDKGDKVAGPTFDRSKHVPPRTRKDSWSDSESSCSSSSYSGSGSESSNSEPEHYSRTNKFESTRPDHKMKSKSSTGEKEYFRGEPHMKKARMNEPDKYAYAKTSKPKGPKSPDYMHRSPPPPHQFSPPPRNDVRKQMPDYGSPDEDGYSNGRSDHKRSKGSKSKEYYSPPPPVDSMYNKSSSKSHGSRDHMDYHPRSPPPPDYPVAEGERARKKKSSKSDDSGTSSHNGDPKKIELLQQLKVIEEAIARKRSKLN